MQKKTGIKVWFATISRYKYLYLMVAPAVISMLIFSYIPMLGLQLAFKELKFSGGIWASPWVGFRYFNIFFSDPNLVQLIVNTVVISSLKAIVAFPFPVMLAIMINEVGNARFKKVSQTLTYLPHFVSWVVVAALIERVFAPGNGLINQLAGMLGGDSSRFFMMEKGFFYPLMFFSYLWKDIGWNSIIYVAAITSIDPSFYEAAKIDGASKWREIWHITLPCIKATMGIIFILSLGRILSGGFDQVYLLRTPGNKVYSEILDTYVIRQGLEKGNFSYATAIGLIQGIAGLIMVSLFNYLGKKYTEVSIW